MNRARAFFYVCAGLFLLAGACGVGVAHAAYVVSVISMCNDNSVTRVFFSDGDSYYGSYSPCYGCTSDTLVWRQMEHNILETAGRAGDVLVGVDDFGGCGPLHALTRAGYLLVGGTGGYFMTLPVTVCEMAGVPPERMIGFGSGGNAGGPMLAITESGVVLRIIPSEESVVRDSSLPHGGMPPTAAARQTWGQLKARYRDAAPQAQPEGER